MKNMKTATESEETLHRILITPSSVVKISRLAAMSSNRWQCVPFDPNIADSADKHGGEALSHSAVLLPGQTVRLRK